MNCVLFRACNKEEEDEAKIADQYFPTYTLLTSLPPNMTVISRYCFLPFAKYFVQELSNIGCRTINSLSQHELVADVVQYSDILGDMTPKTYTEWSNLPEGAYVLKGRTNSKKFEWDKKMFAPTVRDIPEIARRLLDDELISEQGIVVREYVPLKRLGDGINGLPISEEYRIFLLNGKIMAGGFYWSSEEDMSPSDLTHPPQDVLDYAVKAASKIDVPFLVVDVGRKVNGDPIVIELNDGQMSGLSCCDPHELYGNLAKEMEGV